MPLKTLVRIKAFKLDRAERNMRRSEASLQAAHHAHSLSVTLHQQYRQWRKEEESRLFNLCKKQVLNRKSLEQWQQKVTLIRVKDARLEEDIAQCVRAVSEEREHLQLNLRHLVEAQHQVEKINQLNQNALAEEQMLFELKEELELDEFRHAEVSPE
jgi:Arc/MetJ family transcription regulator